MLSANIHLAVQDDGENYLKKAVAQSLGQGIFTLDVIDTELNQVTVFATLRQLEMIAGTINDLVAEQANPTSYV